MTDDLISRQDAINLLKKWSDGYDYIEIETKSAIKHFQQLSTADVKPVVRGEWIDDEMVCKARCSACDTEWSWISNEMDRFNFCPNCGAEMKGKDDGLN